MSDLQLKMILYTLVKQNCILWIIQNTHTHTHTHTHKTKRYIKKKERKKKKHEQEKGLLCTQLYTTSTNMYKHKNWKPLVPNFYSKVLIETQSDSSTHTAPSPCTLLFMANSSQEDELSFVPPLSQEHTSKIHHIHHMQFTCKDIQDQSIYQHPNLISTPNQIHE